MPRSQHRSSVLIMIVAATFWSLGGILIRQLALTNAWEIVFWRSLFMALFVFGTLLVMHGRKTPSRILAVGWPGLISGALLAGTFFFYIGSLTRTTVANTSVLMSVSPFLAAIAGRVALGEVVPWRTWLAMAVAFGGIIVMFADSLEGGRASGNVLALGVSVCFALNLTMLRKFRATADMLPTVLLAGLWSLLPAFLFAGPFSASANDIAWLALMGCVQLGAGCLLMTAASKHLSATELGLLSLLEPILGPIWVWWFMAEQPAALTLVGAAIVLTAVIANEAFAAYSERSLLAQPR
jgi:drug/metabolite transporter (DMT)-like permease